MCITAKRCKVITVANQKGGVSKTTTVVNLGIGLARKGKRVLVIDADGQGSLTASLGFGEPDEMEKVFPYILEKIANDEHIGKDESLIRHIEGISVMPCNIDLSVFEVDMVNMMRREFIIKQYVDIVREDYDFILIDCTPSLGLITVNALTAADSVIIPLQATYLPIKGLQQLFKSIGMVRRKLNPDLKIEGILISMVDGRTKFSKEIISLLEENYGNSVHIFNAKIPNSIRVAECPAEGKSIYEHDPSGKAAKAFENLTEEVLQNE